MGGLSSLRKTMAMGAAIAATVVGASLAMAQEGPPVPVNFSDPATVLADGQSALDLNVREDNAARFEQIAPSQGQDPERPRRLELELAAGGGDSPVDVSVAQRASLGANSEGDIDRRGSGSELRVGRNLVDERENSREPSVYVFVASDDEALTWQPGSRSEFGGSGSSFALQERVEVGDMSAGVTYEQDGVQASLAYVEREQTTRVGNRHYSQDQSFAGVTVTMRR